ncbi:TonB-dependent receptor [Paraglaciecola marina]|uniref:TonB-dependent receptor n=1 Tax=Paraglaciecola marina TaxID=2500157 RepID=UPI001EF0D63B|nr:TonB-dependent receptor [Paraglaciecola marina]
MFYVKKRQAALCAIPMLMTPYLSAQETPNIDKEPIETIVITAELIERSVLKSGSSVELFDQNALKNNAGLLTLRDVLDSVGNISLVTGTGKGPTVRGVDGTGPAENANAFFAGSRPRLSWQVDGRPASYNEVVFGDLGLFDVEQVEVLRGPQSTLVGRNAIAGTVVINTHDPVFESAGKARVALGNFNAKQLSGMINIPISEDRLALRVSADWFEKESSISYDSYVGVENPGEIKGKSLRGKLLYLPDTERDSKLMFSLAHTSYQGPNSEIIVRPFNERRSNFPEQPQHKPETTSFALEYDLALNDKWNFAINTSVTDFEFTRTAAPDTSNATIDTTEYVIEPQLHYENEGMASVMGLYYYQARQDEFIEFIDAQNFDDETDTLAAYAESVVSLSPTIELSLGLRYEQEDRKREGGDVTGSLVDIYSDETYYALLPKLGVNWQASENINWGLQISKGYNAGGGGVTFAFPIVNYSFDDESVWTFDFYGRQEYLDGHIQTTQNLFFSQYTDMQLPFDLTPDDSSDEAFVVRNADKVNTSGLELGITALITNSFNLWGNIALLDSEITDYPDSGVEGNELLTAPNFTARLGFSWQKNNWQTSLNTRYSNSYYTDVNNRPGGETDAYVVLDAQLSYQADKYRVFAVVKNLFDTDKAVAKYSGTASADSELTDSDFDTAVLLQPRTFQLGVELKY